jgi:uncharacterized caspase-like protein
MKKIVILGCLSCAFFLFWGVHAHGAKRTALVIGNGMYQTAPLKNPVNDAVDMANVLTSRGFEVTVKINADMREMITAVRAFGKQLRTGRGVGLFYYAGHGFQLAGRNYLVPIGSEIQTESEAEFEAFDAGRILGQMADAGNDLNIVILDACRNNPFARSFRSSVTGLAKMDAPKGSIIAYATSPGNLAADGDGRNGLYTKHLIRNIQEPALTVEQVFKNVRMAVAAETASKQIPWESSSLMGDFYFEPGNPAVLSVQPGQPIQSVPQPNMTPQSDAGSYEIIFWESIKDSANADAFTAYLEQYPAGAFAPLARIKLQQSSPGKKTAAPQPVPKETNPTHVAAIDPDKKDPDIIARDSQYIKYKNGIVYDTQTGLEWMVSSASNLNDSFAKRWVSRLTIDGGGWRMPSKDELKSLYQKGAGTRNMTRLIEANAWHFFSRDSETWHWKGFDFQSFRPFGFRYDGSFYDYYHGIAFSALAVRSRK